MNPDYMYEAQCGQAYRYEPDIEPNYDDFDSADFMEYCETYADYATANAYMQ